MHQIDIVRPWNREWDSLHLLYLSSFSHPRHSLVLFCRTLIRFEVCCRKERSFYAWILSFKGMERAESYHTIHVKLVRVILTLLRDFLLTYRIFIHLLFFCSGNPSLRLFGFGPVVQGAQRSLSVSTIVSPIFTSSFLSWLIYRWIWNWLYHPWKRAAILHIKQASSDKEVRQHPQSNINRHGEITWTQACCECVSMHECTRKYRLQFQPTVSWRLRFLWTRFFTNSQSW